MLWRRGRDSNPRWGLAHTRFPGVRLKPLIHLSEARDYAMRMGVARASGPRLRGTGFAAQEGLRCAVCTIFMAEPMSAETSVMLLGTMRVVVASAATFP